MSYCRYISHQKGRPNTRREGLQRGASIQDLPGFFEPSRKRDNSLRRDSIVRTSAHAGGEIDHGQAAAAGALIWVLNLLWLLLNGLSRRTSWAATQRNADVHL